MIIKILGSGCSKCRKLAQNAAKAAEEAGIDYQLVKVTDMNKITGYGVPMTPALVIDEVVKSVGEVLSVDKIKMMMQV
jgi:small redox-active disulfide protein 2